MKFSSESIISHPRDAVFCAYRDSLSEIVPFMEDITAIDVLNRVEGSGRVELHNLWRVDQDVPAFAKAFVKKEMLCWDDYAVWVESGHRCEWRIKTRAFRDAVECFGSNTFHEMDDGRTRVVLEGRLDIDLKKVRAVPSFLSKSLGPKLERFIVNLVTPNLSNVNASIERYLNSQSV